MAVPEDRGASTGLPVEPRSPPSPNASASCSCRRRPCGMLRADATAAFRPRSGTPRTWTW